MSRGRFIFNIIAVAVGVMALATPLWPVGMVLIPLSLLLLMESELGRVRG